MSFNPLGKKVKKAAGAMGGGPAVEAVKPKPSMNLIGAGMKRPVTKPAPSTSASTSSSPLQTVKKPRLDFSSTAPAAKSSSGPSQSTSHLRPPLDELHKPFCERTEVDYETFDSELEECCKAEKFNKAVRMICAVLRDVEKKKDTSGMISFEEKIVVTISRTIKEYGEMLKNVNLSRAIFYMLCTIKGMPSEKQALLVSWVTQINQSQTNGDPIVITSYLYDALGERNWIDKPHSVDLVTRILRYFGTKFPTRAMYANSGSDIQSPDYVPDETTSPIYLGDDEDEIAKRTTLEYLIKSWDHYSDPPPRSLLRTMNAFASYPEVRLQAAKRIDGWLQNAKLQRAALEVLLFIGCNMGDMSNEEMDEETMGYLLRLRSYKSKMVTPVYTVMLREIIAQSKGNLRVIVHILLQNEFGPNQARFHLNMQLFHALFSIDNKNTTRILGCELAVVMTHREENYKPARLFIRELVRSCLRTDFLFATFTRAFIEQMEDEQNEEEEGEETVRRYAARLMVDTCTWIPLVAITQQIKDAFANRRANGSAAPSALETITKFQNEMREYYRVVVEGVGQLGPLIVASQMEYPPVFYRMLFLEQPESYSSLETGTSDEITQGLRVISECSINEKLICLITKCSSLSIDDRFALLDVMVRNAIHTRPAYDVEKPLLNLTSLTVFEHIFKMAEVKEANGVTLESYFWKGWKLVVLLLCATPPPPAFDAAFQAYPMMRMLTKMILLGNFTFPLRLEGKTPETIKEEYEKLKADEVLLMVGEEEKGGAGGMLCMMGQSSIIRAPPRPIALDLSQLALGYRMSAELAQMRQPDLLSRLIAEEGTSAAMPAIEAVIRLKADSHSFIPIVCITQFLLHHLAIDVDKRAVDDSIVLQMSGRLRDTVLSSLSLSTPIEEGMGDEGRESFLLLLDRLASGMRSEREAAVALVTFILNPEMELPQLQLQPAAAAFSLEKLATMAVFETIRSVCCSSLAKAFRVESETGRVEGYVRFIEKHARREEMHTLSSSLCLSSPRHDDSIRSALLHFFARYVEEMASGEKIREEDEEMEEEKKKKMEMVVMESKGKKIPLVSSTLFFILELLSRFRGGGGARDRLLSLILSPSGDLPVVRDEEGETIELLNDHLRGAMLSSTDESIVKVALGRVNPTTAFNMICTYGLTTFSASNLMKSLDALSQAEIESIDTPSRALPFLLAYRKMGAEGGEKFFSLISSIPSDDSVVAKEEPEEEDGLVLLPPPSMNYRRSGESGEVVPTLNKSELSRKLKEMVAADAFSISSIEFRSAAVSEANTEVCLEFLELNLKFFLSHVGAFNEMLQLVCAATDKYPSAKAKLATLCTKVLKSAAVPAAIEEQIRKLAEGPAMNAAPKQMVEKGKKPLDLKCATAEDLLETLHKRKNLTSIERARLINRFVLLRPEVIDIRMMSTEIDRQITRVFGVQAREGLDRLVAQLWLRASPETIDCVLKRVLKQYNQSLSPSAVLDLLRHCASSPSYLTGLTNAELRTACAYLVEKATEDFPSHPSILLSLADFIAILLPITTPALLEELACACVQIDRSTATRQRRAAAAALLDVLQRRFPCLHVSQATTRVTIEGGHDGIESADKEITMLLRTLFDSKDDSVVASAIDSLTHVIHFNRPIMIRQLPVMSRLIARISEHPAQQIREHRRFRWIINFLTSSMTDLMPDLPVKNTVDLDRLIDGLLDFNEKHVKGSRDELELSRRVLDLILVYLRNQRTEAREFIHFVGSDRVNGMLENVRDEAFEDIKIAIEG